MIEITDKTIRIEEAVQSLMAESMALVDYLSKKMVPQIEIIAKLSQNHELQQFANALRFAGDKARLFAEKTKPGDGLCRN